MAQHIPEYEVSAGYYSIGVFSSARAAVRAALAFEQTDEYDGVVADEEDFDGIVIVDINASERSDGYFGWDLDIFAEMVKAGEIN